MIKYCKNKWDKNKEELRKALENYTKLNSCEYLDLLKLVVDNILNDSSNGELDRWNSRNITVIDNGDYQGTLLFLIPNTTYQPCEFEYLMTYVGYGSCSGCDTLLSIQDYSDRPPTREQLNDYMTLCRDMVCNMIKPYNCGWRNEEEFEPV